MNIIFKKIHILLKQNISKMNERQQKERDDNEEPKNVN